MEPLHTLKITNFQQPNNQVYTRTMQGPEEIIQYPPGSHVRIWCNTDPENFDSHYHNCAEIIFMYEGECTYSFSSKEVPLKTGDIVVIPPYMMHKQTANHPYKQFVALLDVGPLINFGLFSTHTSSIKDILLCNTETCPQIYNSIYNSFIDMINSYFTYNSFWEIESYSYFMQMLICIGRNIKSTAQADAIAPTTTSKIQFIKFEELLQYMDANFSEQLSLEDMSNRVGFSKYHFVRLFKEYTGTTFYNYLTNKRIQHAKILLSGTDEITDIAFQCGYNNQTSFCRSFKKLCGCPPTEYRQQLQEKHTN